MWSNRKNAEAAQRFAARQEREDAAPRLALEAPGLKTLSLRLRDEAGGRPAPEPGYVRHIVVTTAPALFLVPCGNAACIDGGHDITHYVLQALRARKTEFEGTDECTGTIGAHQPCTRILRFAGQAEYVGD